jgi:archaellum component FlaC
MSEEISKVWILEQMSKVYESVKNDVDKLNNKFDSYPSNEVCKERRMSDDREIKRMDDRIDDIDNDIDNTKQSFDKKWDTLTFWVWGLLIGVVVELVGLLTIIVFKIK